MALYVKQDYCTDSDDIATTMAALVGTVTTWYGQYVLKDGSSRYIVVVVYDGTA